ncbi:MAG: hypothetical protein WC408_05910 [Candidatus Micrarchaeia archaeon]|jgi:hypothetical protein
MKTRTLIRKCLVCGKKIRTKVNRKGNYDNGHYFGKLKTPIKGTGEWENKGTTRIGKMKVGIVHWTGKEKESEYWECNACFEQAGHECWLEEKIEKLYGERCKDFEENCPCCQAWDAYDNILHERKTPKRKPIDFSKLSGTISTGKGANATRDLDDVIYEGIKEEMQARKA